MEKIKIRESNFELLRFVSMILIILYHMVLYGVFNGGSVSSNYNVFYAFFYVGGKVGVVLFILITGYFLCNRDIKIRKLFKLEGQALFYSILSLLIFLALGNEIKDNYDVVRSFLPNLLNTYWFYSAYFALYLFIPYINKAVKVLKQYEFRNLLIIGFVFLILIPTLFIYNRPITSAIYLLYYYLVGSYVRLYCDKIVIKTRILVLGSLLFYVAMVIFSLLLFKLSLVNEDIKNYIYCASSISSVLVFMVSMCIFLLFKNIKINYCKIINLLGSVSFGVYLFHDNFFMRDMLWRDLFGVRNWNSNFMFVVYGIGVSILIYVVFGGLEYIRALVMDKWLFCFFGDKVSFVVNKWKKK